MHKLNWCLCEKYSHYHILPRVKNSENCLWKSSDRWNYIKCNKSGWVPIKIINEGISRLKACLNVRIAEGKVFYFGHLCQLLLHAVIFSSGKSICKSRVSTTGLKSDKLRTYDGTLSFLGLPGPWTSGFYGMFFWQDWHWVDAVTSLASGILAYF